MMCMSVMPLLSFFNVQSVEQQEAEQYLLGAARRHEHDICFVFTYVRPLAHPLRNIPNEIGG